MNACSPVPKTVPPNLSVAEAIPRAWPAPLSKAAGERPVIQAMRFSSLEPRLGTNWNGDFLVSTNTASVEVIGVNIFSFSTPHVGNGRFHFQFHLIDVPPFFVRTYDLRVIARNVAGDASEEDVPFQIRGRE